MKIEHDVLLKDFTTLKVGGVAKFFLRLSKREDVIEILSFVDKENVPIVILGGGSNVVVSDTLAPSLFIKNEILGKEIIEESDTEVLIAVGAGENWDEFVEFCVGRGFAGVEALSAIPGTVGGAPIQNIGAYGAEVSTVIDSALVYDIERKDFQTLSPSECEFEYRNSLFKKNPGRYIVLKVIFSLKKNTPVTIPDYPGVKEELTSLNPTLEDVRKAIVKIRSRKLPDPRVIPNVGSFFKNPIVSKEALEAIKNDFPNIKNFPAENEMWKIPAGWLIENAGLKGADFGRVGTYHNNALVLVNNGNANSEDFAQAEKMIKLAVKEKFGIELEREPIIIS